MRRSRHVGLRRLLLAAALLVGFILVTRPSAMIEASVPEPDEPELALVLPSFPPTNGPRPLDPRPARRARPRRDGPIRSRLAQRIPGLGSTPARPRRAPRPLAGREEQAARPP